MSRSVLISDLEALCLRMAPNPGEHHVIKSRRSIYSLVTTAQSCSSTLELPRTTRILRRSSISSAEAVYPPSQIQVIIVVVPSLAPAHDNLLLLLLVGHGVQQLLELCLCDLLPQLTRLREHDESVLDVGGSLLFDEADAAQSVGRFGVEDLVEDALARVVVLSV